MKVFIDSSIFLKLLLNEEGADAAQRLLEAVEKSEVLAYTTPLVLEEVSFKLLIAAASSLLNSKDIWRIREKLARDEKVRAECFRIVDEFSHYVEYLAAKGLRVEAILYSDWLKSLRYMEAFGLLPADALHLAVAERLGVSSIATFDEDFKRVSWIKTIP
ncbi:MAG: PIN domain-containing protein [Thermofilaceae archaeon]